MYSLHVAKTNRAYQQKKIRSPFRSIKQTRTKLNPILQLHQTIGNQAVGKMIQAKLTINQPTDKFEQEADRVADTVMRMPMEREEEQLQRQPMKEEEELQRQQLEEEEVQRQAVEEMEELQRQPMEEEEEEVQMQSIKEDEEEAQMKSAGGGEHLVTPRVQSRIDGLKGGGQPLPKSTRAFFEPRFGSDFSSVRVHADTQAGDMARSVNARAFTVGRNVVFGAGQYSPETTEGKKLLAHELTHTIQQRSGSSELNRTIQLTPVPATINGVAMTKRSSVNDTNLENVVTDVLKRVIKTPIGGVNLDAIYVYSVNDLGHSRRSLHYKDLAIDMSRVKTNGVTNWQYMSTSYPNVSNVKKVVEALQNGFEGEVGRPGVYENYGPYFEKRNGRNYRVGGHKDHIHISCNK
jgi:hypothetical protein